MTDYSKLDLKAVLDGLGQGVLLFDTDGNLIVENLAARTLLGTDIKMIQSNGWDAVSTLFNTRQKNPDNTIEAIRDKALESERPVRFYIYLSGEYTPCWAATVQGDSGEVNLLLTLDVLDWSAVQTLLDTFRTEMKEAVQATQGHIDIITQTINHAQSPESENLSKRIAGFTRLISIHMHRVARLMNMMERLENVRTGKVREVMRQNRRRIDLADYIEDFVEELDEIDLVDPETDAQDHRSRLKVDVPAGLIVSASSFHLTRILHDVLRNAIMYSMRATPITLKASSKNSQIQFDIVDEGYGVREKESERVFEAFERARQPQIIAEFGYGLSLYICKHEVEAMNGRMWYESEEGVGTTLSFLLPVWRDEAAAASSSQTTTT